MRYVCDTIGKGKITYQEALNCPAGFLQYLWYNAIRETKANQKRVLGTSKSAEDLEAVLKGEKL